MSDEAKHIFGAKCPNCGHVNYYDKRRVCRENREVTRGSETKLDELWLKCEKCGEEFVAEVDCEGYT